MCNVGIAVPFIMKFWLHHNCSGRKMSPFSEASAAFSDCVHVCSSFSFYIPWLALCNEISLGLPRIVIHIVWFSKSRQIQQKHSPLGGRANRNAVLTVLCRVPGEISAHAFYFVLQTSAFDVSSNTSAFTESHCSLAEGASAASF